MSSIFNEGELCPYCEDGTLEFEEIKEFEILVCDSCNEVVECD